MSEQIREEFETWMASQRNGLLKYSTMYSTARRGKGYVDSITDMLWESWQAARRAESTNKQSLTVAAPEREVVPVAWSLRFRNGDKYERVGPVNYMTTFGSKEDADIYANRVARDLDGNPKPERMPVVVPLYAAPQHAEQQLDITRLVEALESLVKGYVILLKAGADRITSLGGDCDPVPVMERNDPWLRDARAALAAYRKETGHE